MPPGTTAQAQRLVMTCIEAFQTFPTALKGKTPAQKNQWLVDSGFLDELPSEEVRAEAARIFERMRAKQREGA